MWELIDFKTRYWDNGCDTSYEDNYTIRNVESKETRVISDAEYNHFKKLGLIK